MDLKQKTPIISKFQNQFLKLLFQSLRHATAQPQKNCPTFFNGGTKGTQTTTKWTTQQQSL
ncbi:hypothetical protein GCWU000324_00923 [Kingella oralis ATCC 51147]|jgi:hypothetical protein|uniref:Uncharacterized protein n=1 Tax=Kingella oralis ATCC 51147 TaxID=629741 RepID=C4GFK7_9NEIS|nr:hypothetical protein GCWU000324_00923 [Kingella oralis ATCC 51147]